MKLNFRQCVEKKKVIYLFAVILLFTLTFFGGAKINSLPQRCMLCHNMKPEYYTWLASTHGAARVSCISCHSPPGIKGFFTAKFTGMKEIYSAVTGSYVSPIKMTTVIGDQACERCHSSGSMNSRSSGDIIVDHKLHKAIKVNCVKCHAGIAHGKIAERKVTYVSDYEKWEKALGESLMADKNFTEPDMDVCFRCHKLRTAPVTCTSCHRSSKVPASHKEAGFKQGGHGRAANQNIMACDNCHRFMTDNQIEGLSEPSEFEEFLQKEKSQKIQKSKQGITAAYYSRVNMFCRNCHSKRPQSHDAKYLANHRQAAEKSKTGCLTCHNNLQHRADPSILGLSQSITANAGTVSVDSQSSDSAPSTVVCGSCHPSSHSESTQWKMGFHPVPLPAELKITRYCYYCHRETECSACHGKIPSIKIQKEE